MCAIFAYSCDGDAGWVMFDIPCGRYCCCSSSRVLVGLLNSTALLVRTVVGDIYAVLLHRRCCTRTWYKSTVVRTYSKCDSVGLLSGIFCWQEKRIKDSILTTYQVPGYLVSFFLREVCTYELSHTRYTSSACWACGAWLVYTTIHDRLIWARTVRRYY